MKKRKLDFIIMFGLSLFMLGCSNNNVSKNIREYKHDMDIDEAIAMIDEAEWDCAWLQTQDSISRSDAEALVKHIDSMIEGIGTDAICTQMDMADWENSSIKKLSLLHKSNQPTIYHKGISVVSAAEEHRCEVADGTDDCKFHLGTLNIRKEYNGDDPSLQGWYLEYIFQQIEHDGEWSFSCYNGTYNTDANLELRESFYNTGYNTVSFQNFD